VNRKQHHHQSPTANPYVLNNLIRPLPAKGGGNDGTLSQPSYLRAGDENKPPILLRIRKEITTLEINHAAVPQKKVQKSPLRPAMMAIATIEVRNIHVHEL
jgi:hypothetical protein